MTLLSKLKILLECEDDKDDELLLMILSQAKDFALSYCNLPSYDERLDAVVLRMAFEDFGKIGSGGISYRKFSGAYESYTDGYSRSVIDILKTYRRMPHLKKPGESYV